MPATVALEQLNKLSSRKVSCRTTRRHRRFCFFFALAWLLSVGGGVTINARAALQFDVFLGYDGVVPEASWFPVICEVKNDGPPFTATFELSSGAYNQSQTRTMVVELPTGTLKRFVMPVFATTRYNSMWSARLLDERGKVRGEQPNLRPRKQMAWESPLIGALARTVGGVPVIQQILPRQTDLQPTSARLQPALIPDNPLVLEGLDALYLNSEKAVELNVNQVNALLTWMHAGGHLIVGVEQISDINSSPWLRNVFPCEVTSVRTVQGHSEIQEWLRAAGGGSSQTNKLLSTVTASEQTRRLRGGANRPTAPTPVPFSEMADDPDFEKAELPVAVGAMRDGKVLAGTPGTPFIVTAKRGRGRITALLFSPEREPFRSWKNSPSFWARLADVPMAWYTSADFNQPGGWSLDGVFGAMIDSKQVRKLPVTGLLLLLAVYLLVIGPLDQRWLKRINRQMLTWVTFPIYVVLFSLLIYFIGYKLRAGESEWNELHVLDVLQKGERAELRGRAYGSIYSPVNARYQLVGEQRYAALRGEFQSSWGGGQESGRGNVEQKGDGYRADIFVPVWTSQLYISDWWQSAALPLKASVTRVGDEFEVTVENLLDRKLTEARLVLGARVYTLNELPARQTQKFQSEKLPWTELTAFVQQYGNEFQSAAQRRRAAFGESVHLSNVPLSAMAASFVTQLGGRRNVANNYQNSFLVPPGFDLSALTERGDAVLLAWDAGHLFTTAMNRFTPRRSTHDTLLRLAIPVTN
ncbi:MAG: hypothetical protein HY298_03455 [Verrucomicrobia bacterium]|nr:hypothetical protein [Verrucomicrobiota bacterium]